MAEARIILVKVSHARKFFIVAFSHGPFELLDLNKMCVLRTMPRKFPQITALEWSPLSSGKVRKNQSQLSIKILTNHNEVCVFRLGRAEVFHRKQRTRHPPPVIVGRSML